MGLDADADWTRNLRGLDAESVSSVGDDRLKTELYKRWFIFGELGYMREHLGILRYSFGSFELSSKNPKVMQTIRREDL